MKGRKAGQTKERERVQRAWSTPEMSSHGPAANEAADPQYKVSLSVGTLKIPALKWYLWRTRWHRVVKFDGLYISCIHNFLRRNHFYAVLLLSLKWPFCVVFLFFFPKWLNCRGLSFISAEIWYLPVKTKQICLLCVRIQLRQKYKKEALRQKVLGR